MKIETETGAWPPARTRPPECLSDFAFERLQHGELQGQADARARGHLETCPLCGERAAALTAAAGGPNGAPPPIDLDGILMAAAASPAAVATSPAAVAALPAATRWRRLFAVVGAGTVALGLVLWLAVRPPPEERLKGPPAWRLKVLRQQPNGAAELVAPGGAVRPGDRIGFEITAPADGFAAVVSLDGKGAVTAFYPAAGDAVAVTRGRPHRSRHAVALDDALGPERLILAGCARPVPVDQLVAAARRALAEAGGRAQAVDRLDVRCEQTTFWLTKVPR